MPEACIHLFQFALLLFGTTWPAAGGNFQALAGGQHAEAAAADDCPNLVVNNEWDMGIDCVLQFVVDHEAHGWEIHLTFDSVLTSLDCWQVHYLPVYCTHKKS
jgi:hypothetical protein